MSKEIKQLKEFSSNITPNAINDFLASIVHFLQSSDDEFKCDVSLLVRFYYIAEGFANIHTLSKYMIKCIHHIEENIKYPFLLRDGIEGSTVNEDEILKILDGWVGE
jgi:hypothetical protein